MQRFEKRLQDLENQLKARANSGLWIDCHNNHVRVNLKAGKSRSRSFDTVCDAVSFIEGEIDNHEKVFGSLVFDDVFQLYRDSEGLKKSIEEIMPPGEFKEKSGVVFGNLKTGFKADIKLLVIRSLLMHFNTVGFYERWHTGKFNESDRKLTAACFELFQWEREGDPHDIWDLFVGLFLVMSGLNSAKIASDY